MIIIHLWIDADSDRYTDGPNVSIQAVVNEQFVLDHTSEILKEAIKHDDGFFDLHVERLYTGICKPAFIKSAAPGPGEPTYVIEWVAMQEGPNGEWGEPCQIL